MGGLVGDGDGLAGALLGAVDGVPAGALLDCAGRGAVLAGAVLAGAVLACGDLPVDGAARGVACLVPGAAGLVPPTVPWPACLAAVGTGDGEGAWLVVTGRAGVRLAEGEAWNAPEASSAMMPALATTAVPAAMALVLRWRRRRPATRPGRGGTGRGTLRRGAVGPSWLPGGTVPGAAGTRAAAGPGRGSRTGRAADASPPEPGTLPSAPAVALAAGKGSE